MNSNESKPLVTVIVPTIGRPEYILHTIQSTLNQTYLNIQILISDNAPSIKTSSILDGAGIIDKRIDIVIRPKRMNFCEHMNACILDARGKYVMILSDDDQISYGYVEEMVAIMEAGNDVSVCVGRQLVIKENVKGLIPSQLSISPQLVISGSKFINDFLSGSPPKEIFTYLSIFAQKKDLVEAGGLRNYPFGAHSDNYLVIKLAMKGNIAFSKNLMFYRIYLGSVGLSMPFAVLLEATKKYSSDCHRLINEMSSLSIKEKVRLIQLMRLSSIRLLIYRLRHVYAHRISTLNMLTNLIKIGIYWAIPSR
jgi:glycosyltransferase involved in cell wall biosynthesis